MNFSVYKITLRATGSAYIGMTGRSVDSRWRRHKRDAIRGTGFRFHRALAKHGFDAFDWEVVAKLPTQKEAQIAERVLIALERPTYNLTAGGEGTLGTKQPKLAEQNRTPWKRATVSAAMTGREVSPETRVKIGAAHKGKLVSAETRAKQSLAAKNRAARRQRNASGQWVGPG